LASSFSLRSAALRKEMLLRNQVHQFLMRTTIYKSSSGEEDEEDVEILSKKMKNRRPGVKIGEFYKKKK